MHLNWKGFSSHEIVSLDQLTEDVSNLIPPVQKVQQCSKHPAKELDLYCETCKEVICRDCIVKLHRDHQYDLATAAFPQRKEELISSIEPAEQQLASVNKALEGLDTLRGEINSQCQVLETKVRSRLRLVREALERREEDLISQLKQLTRQKLKNVDLQQDQLELVATRLKSCHGYLQDSLRTGGHVEILAMAETFLQHIQDVMSAFKPECLVPEEQADLEFYDNHKELAQTCQQFGKLVANPVCHAKCRAEGVGVHVAVVGEAATATVHVVDQKGREYRRPVRVSCELVTSDGSSQVRGEVKRVKDSQYEISYCPQHRGRHYLHIRVEDKHISGSPFPLSVISTTPSNIITGVRAPSGLALNNNRELVVAEHYNHCLSIVSDDGKNRRTFGSPGSGPEQLYSPIGVALSATGDILVCEYGSCHIHVFSPTGKSVKCVGTKGSGPPQFSGPRGIAIHPHSNKVYVTEGGSNRVQILNEDLTFCSTFGSKGSGNGHFSWPRGIIIDSTGNVYVADQHNDRIQVFTANGEYIRQFGKKGNGRGELSGPLGITIDSNNIVYVSEWANDRISIFTREGQFLRSFGRWGKGPGQFNSPSGITISNNGVVYVNDFSNDRVQVF